MAKISVTGNDAGITTRGLVEANMEIVADTIEAMLIKKDLDLAFHF